MIAFRHADPRFPFLWEDAAQPPGRWHGEGEGPVHYFADTPDGAWAEFVRHEEIREVADLATIRRAVWAVEIPNEPTVRARLPVHIQTGGLETYAACRDEARRRRARGVTRLEAPSAALLPGGATGLRVDGGLRAGPARDGRTIVLLGPRPALVGWRAVDEGRPSPDLLVRVRHLSAR